MTSDGRVELTLRKPAKSGQRVVLLEPLALLRRLCWLIPPPRQHQIRYAGILASAAKLRREIVPSPPPQLQLVFPIENMRPRRQSFRPSWAKLIARVYDLDAQRCPKCGDRLRPIAAVTDPIEAQRHLDRQSTEGGTKGHSDVRSTRSQLEENAALEKIAGRRATEARRAGSGRHDSMKVEDSLVKDHAMPQSTSCRESSTRTQVREFDRPGWVRPRLSMD